MRLLWPWALLPALALIPLLVIGYRRLTERAVRRRAELARLGLIVVGSDRDRPPGRRSRAATRTASALLLGAMVLLLIGVTRPEAVLAQAHREGTLVIAVDASASMAATDVEPSRIEAAKAAAKTLLDHQPEAIRVAVVAFGDAGVVLQSPTQDHRSASAAIDRVTLQGGTGLTGGIQTSLSVIAGRPIQVDAATEDSAAGGASPAPSSEPLGYYPNSAVVLLSDGENTERRNPVTAAELASTVGVRIFPVGLGSPQGGVIEVDGLKVSTALDEKLLQDIAEVSGGRYYAAADATQLADVYGSIDLGWVVRNESVELTGALAGLAALALTASAALSLRRTGRVI